MKIYLELLAPKEVAKALANKREELLPIFGRLGNDVVWTILSPETGSEEIIVKISSPYMRDAHGLGILAKDMWKEIIEAANIEPVEPTIVFVIGQVIQ